MKINLRKTHKTLFALYLLVGIMNTIEGMSAILFGTSYVSSSFKVILSVAPIQLWGVFALIGGLTILSGLLLQRFWISRIGMMLAFVYTSTFAVSFVIALFVGNIAGPTAITKWLATSIAMLYIIHEPPVNIMTVRGKKNG